VLTELKRKYPDLRIYSFDNDMPLSAVETTKHIFKVKDKLPALVIDDVTYTGYKTMSEIENLLPESFKAVATSTATSTLSTSTKKK
jgi:hypoxanthine phosphoribosyltransferase